MSYNQNGNCRDINADTAAAKIAGILGAILTSLVLLGITFAATSVIGAIIAGLLIAFLALIFLAVSCLILCKAGCGDCENDR